MPLLAIAFPTYKRPALLRKALTVAANQCRPLGIPIYVFDDSCSDVNSGVYDEVRTSAVELTVVRNVSNLGIDRNIHRCYSEPVADYVWVIGEDDLLRDGAVEEVLAALRRSRPVHLFTNYQYVSDDYQTPLHIAVPDILSGFMRADEFIARYGWACGFIGANVVCRERWDACADDYLGTYFNHVGRIVATLRPDESIEIIGDVCVYNRAEGLESFSWLKDCFNVTAGFSRMVSAVSAAHPEWAVAMMRCLREFTSRINLDRLRTLVVLRALGAYDWKKFHTYVARTWRWPLAGIVALLPVAPLSATYRAYRFFKQRARNG